MIRVKKLDWRLEKDRLAENPAWVAYTGTGQFFRVFRAWWGARDMWGFVGNGEFHETSEAAMATAQADFNDSIRRCVVETGGWKTIDSAPIGRVLVTKSLGDPDVDFAGQAGEGHWISIRNGRKIDPPTHWFDIPELDADGL